MIAKTDNAILFSEEPRWRPYGACRHHVGDDCST